MAGAPRSWIGDVVEGLEVVDVDFDVLVGVAVLVGVDVLVDVDVPVEVVVELVV